MDAVEELLTKFNWPKRTTSPSLTVEEIEKIINFKLPDDYLTFGQNYSGFEEIIGQEYVRLWDFDELLEFNNGYQIFANLPKTLGIGTNGSGEFVAIEQSSDSDIRIVISPFIDLNREYHIEIGNSFTDFLKRLDDGQGWFK